MLRLVLTRLAAVLGAVVLVVPVAGAAAAGSSTSLSRIADELRRDGVYVDPAAELAGEVDEATVEDAVAQAGRDTYVAVLPSAVGPADAVPRALASELGRPGNYVALTGASLRAGSTYIQQAGVSASLARQAVDSSGGDVTAALLTLVAELDAAATGSTDSGTRPGATSGAPSAGVGLGVLPLLLLLGLLVGGAALVSSRSGGRVAKRAEVARRREFEDVRRTAEEDVTALGEDLASIDRTDVDLSDPGIDPRIREQQLAAIQSYEGARDALAGARTVEDLGEVSRALEDGRYAMTATRALLRGEEPPPRRQPCFFDPRHGPSVTDVEWAPPGGQQRRVPVCADDAERLARGEEAQARMVWSQGRQVPMWGAPAAYGPFAGGYFGMGTGLFGGLLLGSILTGGMGGGYREGFGDGGGDFGGGGGDFGGFGGGFGGGLGGGDFGGGGGGFGGGDFGGGGGDFR